MQVAIYTLGCKVNQYETQAIEQILRKHGHTPTDIHQEADAYVVNTCSVTAVSDQKSRQMIRRLRREHPNAVIAVCGCYAQTHLEDVRALGVDLIAGTGERIQFVERLEQAVRKRQSAEYVDKSMQRRVFETLPAGGLENRTRAMLKVEDGCTNFCSYCIIPYARGPVRSEPLDTATRQAKELSECGYKEIVLTGIEISSWGRDLKTGQSLIDLIEALCQAVPNTRIRLGSLEPRTVTDDFCVRASALPNLCPQFHLSLQSGCDTTLQRMNRKYTTEQYLHSVSLLRQYWSHPSVTTDLICGFPDETDDEFRQTMDFIQKCRFARMHIFPYSVRPDTPAAKMEQLPKSIKEERVRQASDAAAAMRLSYLTDCIGETYPVLFEHSVKDNNFIGHAPNYMEVRVCGTGLHNQIRTVRITGIDGFVLTGELTEEL